MTMQRDNYNMPGIIDVRFVNPGDVAPNIPGAYLAGVPTSVLVDGTRVSLLSTATCQAVEEHSNNGRIEKATLTFLTCDDVPPAGMLWMVMQASGEWFLIGRREPPYPTVKVQRSAGEPGGDRAVNTVTVEYQCFKALIPLER